MNKKYNRFVGSGIIVVILSAIAFSIYAVSNFAEQEHYGILQQKYEENITMEYEKDYNDIESYYNYILNLKEENI